MEDLAETWPVGLRFKPREDELVDHHLGRKLRGETETFSLIPELYIYKWEPQDLFARYNALSRIPSDGHECFFFCPRDNKIPNSLCKSRKTELGFWKDTSKKRVVRALGTGEEIGFKRILVYYEGRQGDACRTDFVMHEYHLNSNVSNSEISDPMALVVCHIINRKSGKAKSATECTSTDLSGPNNMNDSQNEETQEISAQASSGVIVEFPYPNETSNSNLPDQNVPIPDQQPQTSKEQRLSHDGHWHVDNYSDGNCHMPYSPSDCINLADLFNYDESFD